MKKAPEAFRTISEVAEILETPAHVLRFWESKFYQIRPVKRAGGRRYYRPDDVALINGIRNLLQEQGMTIRGVQRVLQEQGVKHVATLGEPLTVPDPDDGIETIDAVVVADEGFVLKAVDPAHDDQASAPMEPQETLADDDLEIEVAEVVDDEEPTPAPMMEATQAAEDTHAAPAPIPTPAAEQTAVTDATNAALAAPKTAESPQTTPNADRHNRDDPPTKPVSAPDEVESDDTRQITERARIARQLRIMPRGQLGKKYESYQRLSRRIDVLLERMSEASGAGRW